ncbi:MAG: hypothetical protein WC554_13890 [Clostridia bacterium]
MTVAEPTNGSKEAIATLKERVNKIEDHNMEYDKKVWGLPEEIRVALSPEFQELKNLFNNQNTEHNKLKNDFENFKGAATVVLIILGAIGASSLTYIVNCMLGA